MAISPTYAKVNKAVDAEKRRALVDALSSARSKAGMDKLNIEPRPRASNVERALNDLTSRSRRPVAAITGPIMPKLFIEHEATPTVRRHTEIYLRPTA